MLLETEMSTKVCDCDWYFSCSLRLHPCCFRNASPVMVARPGPDCNCDPSSVLVLKPSHQRGGLKPFRLSQVVVSLFVFNKGGKSTLQLTNYFLWFPFLNLQSHCGVTRPSALEVSRLKKPLSNMTRWCPTSLENPSGWTYPNCPRCNELPSVCVFARRALF